jgi:hypothetical protein
MCMGLLADASDLPCLVTCPHQMARHTDISGQLTELMEQLVTAGCFLYDPPADSNKPLVLK